MNNWVKMTNDEMEVGIEIATLKKGELQIKYAKDIVAKDKEIERLNKENEQIRTALNSKESIIKEVREYINDSLNNLMCDERGVLKNCMKLLKGVDKE